MEIDNEDKTVTDKYVISPAPVPSPDPATALEVPPLACIHVRVCPAHLIV